MKDKYQTPKIFSFREGFSADHSHECYGCVICGSFGEEPFLYKCEECGAEPSNESGDYACIPYCHMAELDFCQVMNPGWCVSHHYVVKYMSEKGIIIKSICSECFDSKEEYRTSKYCPQCQAYVPQILYEKSFCLLCFSTGKYVPCPDCKAKNQGLSRPYYGCPFCNSKTVESAPNYWEDIVAEKEAEKEKIRQAEYKRRRKLDAMKKVSNATVVKSMVEDMVSVMYYEEREPYIKAIKAIRDVKAVDPLIECLNIDDNQAKGLMAEKLGYFEDKRAVGPLIHSLLEYHDWDRPWEWNYKILVVRALGKIGDERAVGPLVYTMNSNWCNEDYELIEASINALNEIKDERSIKYFIEFLKNGPCNFIDDIIKSLNKFGEKAEDLLLQEIKTFFEKEIKSGNVHYDRIEIIIYNLIYAIKKIGTEKSIDVLIEILPELYDEPQKMAVKKLKKFIWKPETIKEKVYFFLAQGKWDKIIKLGRPALELFLQDIKDGKNYTDYGVVEGYLEKFGELAKKYKIEYPKAEKKVKVDTFPRRKSDLQDSEIPKFIKNLKDPDKNVRLEAAWSLGELGNETALEDLKNALFDKEMDVQIAICSAIYKINKKNFKKPRY